MIKLHLPKLEKYYWKKNGSKNYVKQLLVPAYEENFSFISSHKGYSVIEKEGAKFCLTANKNIIPSGYEYILLTKQKATQTKLLSSDIKIKEWLRHPMNKIY